MPERIASRSARVFDPPGRSTVSVRSPSTVSLTAATVSQMVPASSTPNCTSYSAAAAASHRTTRRHTSSACEKSNLSHASPSVSPLAGPLAHRVPSDPSTAFSGSLSPGSLSLALTRESATAA